MSQKESFSDNFKRDSEEDMLDYDDSAFFYFSLAVLTATLLPYWYYTFKTLFKNPISAEGGVNCKSAWFQTLIKEKK